MRAALLLCLLGFGGAAAARGQSDSTPLVATLRYWADQTWLTLIDRDAAAGGRFSVDGILQRFQHEIDPDYGMDKIRFGFGMLDNAEWYRHSSGARCYAGSITTTTFAEGCQFQQSVSLGRRWSTNLRFDTANLMEVTRSLPRVAFVRRSGDGVFFSLETTLVPFKPSTTIEAGFGVLHPKDGREISVYFGAPAVVSNLIYDDIGLVGMNSGDSALHYSRQPYTVRLNVDQPIGRHWRVETRLGVMPLATVRRYLRTHPDSAFSQDEWYNFAGVQIQFLPTSRVTVGGYVRSVFAQIDRSPAPYAPPEFDFRVTERTTEAGGLLLWHIGPGWMSENWVGYTWRPYVKTYRQDVAPDVDYEDVALSGQFVLERRPNHGFEGSLAYEWHNMDVIRGVGEVPGNYEAPAGRHNHEIRFQFGSRSTNRYSFQMGLAADLDPIPGVRASWFAGGDARIILYW